MNIKYKLKNNPISMFSTNYMRDYLKEVGIEKTDSFLKDIDKEDEESYKGLNNIEEAIDRIH